VPAERIIKRDGRPAGLDGFKNSIDLYLTGTYNVLRLAAAKIGRIPAVVATRMVSERVGVAYRGIGPVFAS
jgi:hypothetical protein